MPPPESESVYLGRWRDRVIAATLLSNVDLDKELCDRCFEDLSELMLRDTRTRVCRSCVRPYESEYQWMQVKRSRALEKALLTLLEWGREG